MGDKGMFRNIAVLAYKNSRLIKLAELSAKTFPSATYHLISVIPAYKSRPIPGTLIKDLLYEIGDDALSGIELSIQKFNVLNIKEVKLYGEPKTVLTQYLLSKKIDLLVHALMPGEVPGKALPVNLNKVLRSSRISFLFHESCTENIPEHIEKVLLIAGEIVQGSMKALNELLNYLNMKGLLKVVTLLCGEEKICSQVINELRIKELNISEKIISQHKEGLEDMLKKVSREVDLIIGCRKLLGSCQFSSYTRVRSGNVLRYSETPLLLL